MWISTVLDPNNPYVCPRDCPDRHGGPDDCHLTCERYAKLKEYNREKAAHLNKERQERIMIADVQYASIIKLRKRQNRRKK